jgi:hypothetical protein
MAQSKIELPSIAVPKSLKAGGVPEPFIIISINCQRIILRRIDAIKVASSSR